MNTMLLTAAVETNLTWIDPDLLAEGLRVSGIGMLGIFCVMGLFATMIMALTAAFPHDSES